jgi:asparagine synthase (glutamine-hydrolysing)
LSSLERGLTRRGPDGGGRFISGSIAMVYRAFHTNRESRLERQPFVSHTGQILCWDGRLDNRTDLISILHNDLSDDHTDAALVMHAYLKWGTNFLPRLVGDFALSLWDPNSNTLLLARDFVGPRTLYYHIDSNRFIWSTDLALLLELVGIQLEIDDEYVAGFFTKLPEPSLTPYQHFKSVPPAHAVIVEPGRIRAHRFWQPDPLREVSYQTDSEYEEHFLDLFGEAVGCRLRTDGVVWAELSGGMDSSPIVCLASELLKQGAVQSSNLQTVSRVYDEACRSDERKYILPVEQKIGKTGLHLREDDYRILQPWPDDYVPCIPSHVANFIAYYRALNEAMKNGGARVLLSGFGGDEIQLGDGEPFPELVDLLVQGKLLSLHNRITRWSESKKQGYANFAWQNLIAPLLPRKLQLERQQIFTRLLNFYNPQFVKRERLRDRLFGPPDVLGFSTPGRRYRANYFLYTTRQLSAGFWRELCDIEFSYPFTHRPLVEFMLAIPPEQTARPNESKSLARRALGNFLPTELLNRKENRITIWHAATLAVAREAPRIRRLFEEADAVLDKYIDREAVIAACNRSNHPDVLLLPLIPFVHWLRSFERWGRAGKSTTSCIDSVAA